MKKIENINQKALKVLLATGIALSAGGCAGREAEWRKRDNSLNTTSTYREKVEKFTVGDTYIIENPADYTYFTIAKYEGYDEFTDLSDHSTLVYEQGYIIDGKPEMDQTPHQFPLSDFLTKEEIEQFENSQSFTEKNALAERKYNQFHPYIVTTKDENEFVTLATLNEDGTYSDLLVKDIIYTDTLYDFEYYYPTCSLENPLRVTSTEADIANFIDAVGTEYQSIYGKSR